MELTIIQPLTIRMPDGPHPYKAGETITLPEKVALRLMELAPGKVRKIEEPPFMVGQRVRFKHPVNIRDATTYSWEVSKGVVEMIDPLSYLALVIPDGGELPWLWVNMVYVQPISTPKEEL